MQGTPPASSAGGEQPKFTAYLARDNHDPFHAIVKFATPPDNSVARRWADLLVAESLALNVLREAGLPSSSHELVHDSGRVYLIIERFDRAGERGRRPYFPMGILDDEFIGNRDQVRHSAQRMRKAGLISQHDVDAIHLASVFGGLIGNTDQHFGNTSFSWNSQGFFLAPVYDVLPMWYAPRSQGNLPGALHTMPIVFPELRSVFATAIPLAEDFWMRVAADDRISDGFRAIARENRKRCSALREV